MAERQEEKQSQEFDASESDASIQGSQSEEEQSAEANRPRRPLPFLDGEWIGVVSRNPDRHSAELVGFVEETNDVIARVHALAEMADPDKEGDAFRDQVMAIPGMNVFKRWWGDPEEMSIGGGICWNQDRTGSKHPDDGSCTWPTEGLVRRVLDYFGTVGFGSSKSDPPTFPTVVSLGEYRLLCKLAPLIRRPCSSFLFDDKDFSDGVTEHDRLLMDLAHAATDPDSDLRARKRLAAMRVTVDADTAERTFLQGWPQCVALKPKEIRPSDEFGFEEACISEPAGLTPEAMQVLAVWQRVRQSVSLMHTDRDRVVNTRWQEALARLSKEEAVSPTIENCGMSPAGRAFARYCRMWGCPELRIAVTTDWAYSDGHVPDCLLANALVDWPTSGLVPTEQERAIRSEFVERWPKATE